MALKFARATKQRSRLRMALDGPSGSGKTFTGLTFAFALAGESGKVAVVDTERGSASKYADRFPAFDVLELETFSPQVYTDAIAAAEAVGYDVLLIDSLSHAWEGEGGALEMVDRIAAQSRSNNSYTAWRDVTPMHRKMVDAILQAKMHVIVTMRSKTEYVIETNDRGKMEPRKVGMAPIQRAGMEYEFDIVADLDWGHKMVVSKSRCSAVDGDVTVKPSAAWMAPVIAWLSDGATPTEPQRNAPPPDERPLARTANGTPMLATEEDKPTEHQSPAKAKLPPRPWPAHLIREALQVKADRGFSGLASDKQQQFVVASLEALFKTDNATTQEKKRHSLTMYVFGESSSKTLTAGQASALLDWAVLKETDDNGKPFYSPSEHAPSEAAAMVAAYDEEQGQLPMEGVA